MKLARDTALLARRYALQLARNPAWVFVGLSTPLLYLALFTPLLRGVGAENPVRPARARCPRRRKPWTGQGLLPGTERPALAMM